ncbi:MAG: hypothetical protein K0Q49_2185 [Haloplasmataceae bacterium]|jgi:hypothetical protein|nr:hypothetical protein [Haloplasmataceae bacterium]
MLNKKQILPIVSTLVVALIAVGLFFGYKAWINNRVEKGEKQITVEVVVDTEDGKYTKTYQFWTEAIFLGQALDDEVDIEALTSQYGRYIVSVDGYKEDSANGLYWSIYINGEMGLLGMDQQPLIHKDVIKLELKPFTME